MRIEGHLGYWRVWGCYSQHSRVGERYKLGGSEADTEGLRPAEMGVDCDMGDGAV